VNDTLEIFLLENEKEVKEKMKKTENNKGKNKEDNIKN